MISSLAYQEETESQVAIDLLVVVSMLEVLDVIFLFGC